jgi:aminomethyltransferase
MTTDNKSPVHHLQEERGATFLEEDGGWFWANNFGDVDAEFRAIREGASMWDVFALQKWDVTGPDAGRAAQRMFANNLATLVPGQVRYGPIVDASGLMLDDGTFFKHDDNHWWVFTNSNDFDESLAAVAEDLNYTIVNRTLEMPVLSIQGPKSREILQGLTDTNLSDIRYFRFLPQRVDVAGVPVYLLRTGFSGELGFELIPRRDDAVQLWQAMVDAGVVPVGLDAVQIARVEAGLIIMESDYFAGKTSPYDMSLDKMIALDAEVDFIGKEALRKVAENPPNRFKTLRIDGSVVPEDGAAVIKNGEQVGTVTSPVTSPEYGVIGLAVLRSDVANHGEMVEVALPEGTASASVTVLSIHDPDKRKARS